MRRLLGARGAAMLAIVVLLAGCGKDDLNSLVDQAKQQAMAGGEAVAKSVDQSLDQAAEQLAGTKEVLNLAGDMQLTLGEPLSTSACYARVVSIGGGRPNVLQLTSYRDKSQESFPSVFVQAVVTGDSISAISGQTVEAELFAQRESNGPVLFTDVGQMVTLKVAQVEGQTATIEVVGGQLRDSQSGGEVPAQGVFHAVWESTE